MGFGRLRKFVHRSKNSSPAPQAVVSSDASVSGGASISGLQAQSSTNSVTDSSSLWGLAWEKFLSEHADEALDFRTYIENPAISFQKDNSSQRSTGELIAKKISADYKKYQSEHETSSSIKDKFHTTLSFVQKSSKIIEAAVSSNPIAASVWTGVSLLIPILLEPGNQNSAAEQVLGECIDLLPRYYSYEQVLQEEEDRQLVRPACEKVIQLYSTILSFQARLIKHRKQNAAHRLKDNLIHDWQETSSEMKEIDKAFSSLMDAVRTAWLHRENRRRREREDYRQRNDVITALYTEHHPPKGERLRGTCEWFLRRPEFVSWKLQDFGLLWVTADPGCGKSVLAKYLVNSRTELLDRPNNSLILTSFFFSGGQAFSNAPTAICSILNQVLVEAPQHTNKVENFCEGKGMGVSHLKNSTLNTLWPLFSTVIEEVSRDREVICVLDALDECDPDSLESLLKELDELYASHENTDTPLRLRFLLTSRPYEELRRGLKQSVKIKPDVRIDATEDQDAIEEEIDVFIHLSVKRLAEEKSLSEKGQKELLNGLQSVRNRTYLWLHLVLERFKTDWLDASDNITDFVRTLPQSVEEEYSRILDRMKPTRRYKAQAILEIILAAFEPLTAAGVYHAFRMDHTLNSNMSVRSIDDLCAQTSESARDIIRDYCGLFVTFETIGPFDYIYLIHQTARDYLILGQNQSQDEEITNSTSSNLLLHHEISMSACHLRLGKACLQYFFLNEMQNKELFDEESYVYYSVTGDPKHLSVNESEIGLEVLDRFPLMPYAPNFLFHFRYMSVPVPEDLCELFVKLKQQHVRIKFGQGRPCNLAVASYHHGFDLIHNVDTIPLASWAGLTSILSFLREKGENLYRPYERTYDPAEYHYEFLCATLPINEAIINGHLDTVRFLLHEQCLPSNDDILKELREGLILNPLCEAASTSLEMLKVVQSRPDFSAELADRSCMPLLSSALHSENLEILKEVLELGADPMALDARGSTALGNAAKKTWQKEISEETKCKLIEYLSQQMPGAINMADNFGSTPISFALSNGYTWLKEWLLEQGASFMTLSWNERNILHSFVTCNNYSLKNELRQIPPEQIQELINSQDMEGNTPLHLALKNSQPDYAKSLLKIPGIRLDIEDDNGVTPLQEAITQVEESPQRFKSFTKKLIKNLEVRFEELSDSHEP